MKKLLLLLSFCLVQGFFLTLLHAQAPQKFNYQAVLRLDENILSEQAVDLQIDIVNSQDSVLYSERHSTLTDQYGHINIAVGNGSPVLGTFADMQWANDALFMTVYADAGSGQENLGS